MSERGVFIAVLVSFGEVGAMFAFPMGPVFSSHGTVTGFSRRDPEPFQ